MTPLLPTIGQDFGEVGQKSSDAALSNLLLKYQKLHPDLDISSAIFVFVPSSERFIELSIGLSAPHSLFSFSIRRETTFANSTDINSSSE